MNNSRAVKIFHGLGATAVAVGFLYLGVLAADTFNLPFIHGWALMHGTIFVVFPVYFALSFLLLRPVVRRFQRSETHTSLSSDRISILAIASLLLSGAGFLVPIIGSVLGVLAGHIARRRCKKDPQLTGSGFALAGLVLGYLGLAYSIYVIGMISWVASQHGS